MSDLSYELTNRKNGLNATQIKTIAIVAMLIDHIASAFVSLYTVQGQVMHIIGRLTAPIMCFFIVQGYLHTRSLKKYFARMAIFAVISHFPYVLKSTGGISLFPTGVIYTLTLGLAAIYVYDKVNNKALKWLAIIGLCLLSVPGDWPIFGIVMCLIFYIHRDSFKKQCIGITILAFSMVLFILLSLFEIEVDITKALLQSCYQLAVILSLPILYFYNGERGGNKYSGWVFYIFYPLHLLILALIKIFLVQ